MKKLLILVALAGATFLVLYRGYATAPQVVDRVEIEVEGGTARWKSEVSQYILTMVKPGESVDMEEMKYLREKLESLPWVKRCELSLSSGALTVKLLEAKPSFALFFGGHTYLLNSEGYVLEKVEGTAKFSPTYYYKGKTSPFVIDRGFVKIKNMLKTEIELVNRRLRTSLTSSEKPEIALTDTGAGLIFKDSKVIVHLDNGENAWNNFMGFKKLMGHLQPGVYDFRFYDMLVRGRNEGCLNRKS